LVRRLVAIGTWLPALPLKSGVWLKVATLNASMLSTGAGTAPVGESVEENAVV
jgi:hypothetical protein